MASGVAVTKVSNFNRRFYVQLIAFLFVLIGCGILLFTIENLLVSFVIALVAHQLLAPMVGSIERTGISRSNSILAAFLISALLFFLATVLLAPLVATQMESFRQQLPIMGEKFTEFLNLFFEKIQQYSGGLVQINKTEQIRSILSSQAKVVLDEVPEFLSKSVSILFLSPILAFFLLLDGKKFSRQMLSLVPNSWFEVTLNIFYQISQQIGQFIRARLLENILVGAIVTVGLFAIGFPYAILLGAFAGITNILPYVGPVVGIVPAVLIWAIVNPSMETLLLLVAIYVLSQVIDAIVIIPVLVAKIVDLHPLTVILVIILGAQIMGVLGMIISIPVASALKVSLQTVYRHMADR